MADDKSVFNPDAARFNSFVDAMKRSRWLLLISTLVSSILLIHMYLDQFGFQEQQVRGAIINRALKGTEEEAEALKARIHNHHAAGRKDPKDRTPAEANNILTESVLKETATKYAGLRYRMARLDNYLDDLSFPPRHLPLVPVEIPTNDFVPIVGAMLIVFAIANWLNVRTVHASVSSLLTDRTPAAPLPELKELINLHFTFTGLHDHNAQQRIASLVQYLAFSLPCVSMLLAFVGDVWSVIPPLFENDEGFVGSLHDVIVSESIIFIELVTLALVTVATILILREIDREATPQANSKRAARS